MTDKKQADTRSKCKRLFAGDLHRNAERKTMNYQERAEITLQFFYKQAQCELKELVGDVIEDEAAKARYDERERIARQLETAAEHGESEIIKATLLLQAKLIRDKTYD